MSEAATSPTTMLKERVVGDPFFSFASKAMRAETMDEIEAELARLLEPFGIDHFVLFQATDRGRRATAARMSGPRHDEWRTHYVDSGHASRDDFMMSGLDKAIPKTWAKYQNDQPVSKGQQRIFDEASEFGLKDGFYLPMPQGDGSMHGVSMMVPHELDSDERVLAALHLLAQYYDIAATRFGLSPPEPPSPPENARGILTPRQRQCLQWVRAGKTDWEISQIVGLSEYTVTEHIEECRKRLKVRTRTQAVIEAIVLGLIAI